jgi:hypothetical protein
MKEDITIRQNVVCPNGETCENVFTIHEFTDHTGTWASLDIHDPAAPPKLFTNMKDAASHAVDLANDHAKTLAALGYSVDQKWEGPRI